MVTNLAEFELESSISNSETLYNTSHHPHIEAYNAWFSQERKLQAKEGWREFYELRINVKVLTKCKTQRDLHLKPEESTEISGTLNDE